MNLSENKRLRHGENSICFWSWNDKIEEAELLRQIREFANGCFSGVVIHARAGLRVPYMGEEWFRCFGAVVEEAEKLNMDVWIYDEDGWPSGFAGGKVPALGEDYHMKGLEFSYDECGYADNFISAWRIKDSGCVGIENGNLSKGDLVCKYKSDSNYVDLLSAKTVRAFIDSTHEVYKARFGKYFGTVIKGVFTDEPQLSDYAWSRALETYWREKYGEEIRNELYKLVIPTDGSKEFRLRYISATGELFCSSFTKQIADWCKDNGLLLTGHFGKEDGLFSQVLSNAGVMRHYAAMQLPGIDHLGKRNTSPVLEKQVSSIASQLDKPDVLSETFGCAGWDLSFGDIQRIWGRQSALGITLPCFHLSAYSITGRRKRDYPAFFSYQEPYWSKFPEIMKWVNRLNALMKEGRRETDVLVISPLDTVCAEYSEKSEDNSAEYYSAQFRILLENLLDLQLDFEIGDETVIGEYASVSPNAVFKIGKSSYKTVIVSSCERLRPSTVRLLNEFSMLGGRVVYIGKSPESSDALYELPLGETLQNRRDTIEKWIEREAVYRPVTLNSPTDNSLLHGAVIHTRKISGGKRIHIWMGEDFRGGEVIVTVTADGRYKGIYSVDLQSGARHRLKAERSGDVLTAALQTDGVCNTVLELTEECGAAEGKAQPVKEIYIRDCSVSAAEKNSLNIDYAAVAIGDDEFGKPLPVVHQLESIYNRLENMCDGGVKTVRLRYAFRCGGGLDTDGMSVVFEDESVKEVFINGEPLKRGRIGFWIDKGFGEYPIGDKVRQGENIIELVYGIAPAALLKNGFETERNRFFYPVEPESIYIRGYFDVASIGNTEKNTGCFAVENKGFVLKPPTPKTLGYSAEQQMPFYNGDMLYKFRFAADDGNRYFITADHASAVAAVVKTENGERFFAAPGGRLEITDILRSGENEISVTLLGHNRNLLGPHHHIKGVTAMVGPDTFIGKYGLEDFVNYGITGGDTWTDNYNFVPFGCLGFKIISCKR